MKYFILSFLIHLFVLCAHADTFVEEVKITGIQCDNKGVLVTLRSLNVDRDLYLAEDSAGSPKRLDLYDSEQCEGLAKNLGLRLVGKVLSLSFVTESLTRTETEYIPAPPCRTKCSDPQEVQVEHRYQRIETVIDGFRFFDEKRLD